MSQKEIKLLNSLMRKLNNQKDSDGKVALSNIKKIIKQQKDSLKVAKKVGKVSGAVEKLKKVKKPTKIQKKIKKIAEPNIKLKKIVKKQILKFEKQ